MPVGGVVASAGTPVQMNFTSTSFKGTIGNGSPLKDSKGNIIGSLAFAYLTDITGPWNKNKISATPTNFVLFALDDGGASRDDNHDDFVGVVVATGVVPVPAALPLLLTALAGLGLIARGKSADA